MSTLPIPAIRELLVALRAVREVIGCRLDVVSVTVSAGELIEVHVLDGDMGAPPTEKKALLRDHLKHALSVATGLGWVAVEEMPDNGMTVSLEIAASGDGLIVSVA